MPRDWKEVTRDSDPPKRHVWRSINNEFTLPANAKLRNNIIRYLGATMLDTQFAYDVDVQIEIKIKEIK